MGLAKAGFSRSDCGRFSARTEIPNMGSSNICLLVQRGVGRSLLIICFVGRTCCLRAICNMIHVDIPL